MAGKDVKNHEHGIANTHYTGDGDGVTPEMQWEMFWRGSRK